MVANSSTAHGLGNKDKKLRRTRALTYMFVFLLSLVTFASSLTPVAQALIPDDPQASDRAVWVARNVIQYGDKYFVDSNTNDNNWQFSYSQQINNGFDCKSILTFTVNPYATNGGQSANRELLKKLGQICQGSGDNIRIDVGEVGKRLEASLTQAEIDQKNSQSQNNGQGVQTNATCEASGFSLSWILCPVFNGVAGLSDFLLDSAIKPLLQTDTLNITPGDPVYQIWSNFRIYANIFLIIALIVVVFGQTIGGGMVDAYTAKKVLPRLFVAAIGINLSIYIVAILIDIFNVIGGGINQLITAPLTQPGLFSFTIDGGTQAGIISATAIGLLAGVAAGGIAIISGAGLGFLGLFVILPAVISLIGLFAVIMLRKAFILALVLISPVAFAMYALPNTEKYFKKWWEWMFTALIVYPIIMVLFAVADVLTVTIMTANGGNTNTIAALIAFVLQWIVIFAAILAFRIAGGIIGKSLEAITGWGNKGSEFLKGNPNDPTSLQNRVRGNFADKRVAKQAGMVDRGKVTYNPDGSVKEGASRRRQLQSRLIGRLVNPDMKLAQITEQQSKLADMMSATGRDDMRYAAGGYKVKKGEQYMDENGNLQTNNFGETIYVNNRGARIDRGLYERSKAYFGSTLAGVGSSAEYAFRKQQNDAHVANARYAVAKNVLANNWSDEQASDIWAQATYPHKDKSLSDWYSKPVITRDASGRATGVDFKDVSQDQDSLDSMVKEGHRVREAFRWGSSRAPDWHIKAGEMEKIQAKIEGVNSGTIVLNTVEKQDQYERELTRYARMSEELDAMTNQGFISQNDKGEVNVNGASAEVQNVVKGMYINRKYGTTNTIDPSTGKASLTERTLYDIEQADARVRSSGGTLAKSQAAHQSGVMAAIARGVSGDRGVIERSTRVNK